MNTPISPELSSVIQDEAKEKYGNPEARLAMYAYIEGATAYAPYKELFEQAKKALEEMMAGYDELSNFQKLVFSVHAYRVHDIKALLATWKEEGKVGGV